MYCKKCGASISEATPFCPICNHQIRQEETTVDIKMSSKESKAEQSVKTVRFVFTPSKLVKTHKMPRAVKAPILTCVLCLISGALVWTGIVNKNREMNGGWATDDVVFSVAEMVQVPAEDGIAEAESIAETITDTNTGQGTNTEAETDTDTEQTVVADTGEGESQGTTGNTPSGGSSGNSTPDDEWYDTPDGSNLPPGADVVGGEDTQPMRPIFSDMESFKNEFWSRAEDNGSGGCWDLPGFETIWVSKAVYDQIKATNAAFYDGYDEGVTVISDYNGSTDRYSGEEGFMCTSAFIQEGLASGEIIEQKSEITWNTDGEPITWETREYFLQPSAYEEYKNAGRIHGEYIYFTGSDGVMDYRHEYQIKGCCYATRLD